MTHLTSMLWMSFLRLTTEDRWHLWSNDFVMVQWAMAGWLSLGIHVDFRHRQRGDGVGSYGPYVDLHLGIVILSVGWHPVYSGRLDLATSVSRGGIEA